MFNILSQNRFVILSAFVLFSVFAHVIFFSFQSLAQEKPKPKLVEINLQNSNNKSALALSKKLNPDLFETDSDFGDSSQHANFISLDSADKERFLAVTVNDKGYFCTSYGCPTYIYQRIGDNKWVLSLSVQAYNLFQDLNTSGSKPDNIISISRERGSKKITVWIWNGQKYEEANY